MANVGTVEAFLKLRDQFTAPMDRAAKKMGKAADKMRQTGERMSATGSRMTMSLTAPLIAAGAAAFKLSADFQESMTKIETLVGVNRDIVDGWKDSVKELAGETAQAPRDLAEAMFFITSAGLRGTDALETLEASAQAAAIGLGDAASVADAATSAMNAYGAGNLSASEAVNTLALAVRAGKLEAAALAPVMGRLLPTAAALEISFQDVAGAMAVMSRTGLNAAEASTSLSSIMTTLLKPTDGAKKILESVGLSMGKLRDMASKPGGLIEAMRLLNEKTKALSDEALVQVIPNIRAFRGVMNILAQDASVVDDVMAQVASGVDVLGEGMKRVAEDHGFKFKQLMAELKIRFIDMGDELVPAFESLFDLMEGLLKWIADLVKWYSNLDKSTQNLILAFGAVVIAAGPLLLIMGNLVVIFAGMGTAIPALSAFFISMVSPIGAVVLAMGALLLVANQWFSRQAELHEAMVKNIPQTVSYGVAIRDLRVELNEAAAAQRKLNVAIFEAGGVAFEKLNIDLAAAKEKLDELEGSIEHTNIAYTSMGEAIERPSEELITQRGIVAELEGQWTALNAQLHKGANEYVALTKPMKDVSKASKDLTKGGKTLESMFIDVEDAGLGVVINLTGLKGGFTDNTDAIEDNAAAYDLLNRVGMVPAGNSLEMMHGLILELKSALASKIITMEQYGDAMDFITRATEEAEEETTLWGQAFANVAAEMISNADNIGDALHALFSTQAKKWFTEFIDGFAKAMDEGEQTAGGMVKSIVKKFQEMKETGVSVADGIAAGFAAASGETEDLMIGAMTAIMAFMSGNMIAAAAATVGVLIGLWKKLNKKAATFSEQMKGAMDHINKIGFATAKMLERAADVLVRAIQAIGGAIDLSGALQLINDNFNQLVDEAIRLGGVGTDAIARIVEAARQAGIDMTIINERLAQLNDELAAAIEARNNFILEQSDILVQSIERAFASMAKITKRDLAFMAESAVQAFNSMIAAGMSTTEALMELAEAFALIRARGEELEFELPPAFERLAELFDLLADEKIVRMIERLDSFADAVRAAGNLGLLTADQFDQFANRIDRAYQRLIDQGLTHEEALAALAPQLQLLQDMAEQYGFELDNNTQALLDQAIAQGLVAEQGLTTEDILIKGFDRMIEMLAALVVALGGVPPIFESIGESGDDAGDELEDAAEEAGDEWVAEAHRAAEAWEDFGRRARAAVGGIDGLGGPGSTRRVPGFADGSDGFQNFGSGTAAVLHGREQVLTAQEGVGVAQMVADAISSAEGGGDMATLQRERLIESSEEISGEIRGLAPMKADIVTQRRW